MSEYIHDPQVSLTAQILRAEYTWREAKRANEVAPCAENNRAEFAAFAALQILYEAESLLRDSLAEWDQLHANE